MTSYTNLHFEKLSADEASRKAFAKIYRPVTKVEDLDLPEDSLFGMEYELRSFCSNMAQILYDRLQANEDKGDIADKKARVSCNGADFLMLDNFFGTQEGLISRKQRIVPRRNNLVSTPERYFEYRYANGIPFLKQDNIPDWFVHNHGNCHGRAYNITRSYYKEIVVVIYERTGSVFARYVQATEQYEGNDQWSETV